jgi:hypothetical protein
MPNPLTRSRQNHHQQALRLPPNSGLHRCKTWYESLLVYIGQNCAVESYFRKHTRQRNKFANSKSPARSHIQVLRNIDTRIEMPNYKPQQTTKEKKKVRMSAICRTGTWGHQEMETSNGQWAMSTLVASPNLCYLHLHIFFLVADGVRYSLTQNEPKHISDKGYIRNKTIDLSCKCPSKQRHTSQRQVCVPLELPPRGQG